MEVRVPKKVSANIPAESCGVPSVPATNQPINVEWVKAVVILEALL